ncbi:hypothetical protein BJ085DRAFT_39241 [Dimargaris cristalligena]|uniref:Uncharacterized protein n=1 Tax=Dimargaris cristalligena TaxID=215637 RepID=A0A4V1J451_9FUNG|nr:hypothetical protein BJ085DRAFT_39241 [Dimargaris cristalligena]|eukprot:RKP34339.1 hypothetical protein BJ085DRAFT_39241 [Dimargaris cristalligena]
MESNWWIATPAIIVSVEPRQPAGQTKVLIVDLMARLFVAGYLHLEKKTKESPAVKYLSGVQFPPVIKYLLAGKSPLLIEWPLPIESPLPAVEALLSPIESLLPPVESSLLAIELMPPVEYQPVIKDLPPTKILSAAEPQLATDSLLPVEYQPAIECLPPTEILNIPGTGKPRVIARSSIITPSRLPVPVRKWKSAFPALNLSVQSDRINQGVSGVKCQPQPAITLQAQTVIKQSAPCTGNQSRLPKPSVPRQNWIGPSTDSCPARQVVPTPTPTTTGNRSRITKPPVPRQTRAGSSTDPHPVQQVALTPTTAGYRSRITKPLVPRQTQAGPSTAPHPVQQEALTPTTAGNRSRITKLPVPRQTRAGSSTKPHPAQQSAPTNPGWFVNQAPPCPAISTDTNTDYN